MRTACRDFMNRQGPGYRDFAQYSASRKFTEGKRKLACGPMLRWGSGSTFKSPTEFLFEGVRKSQVPTRLVNDTRTPLVVIRRFPKFNGMRVKVRSSDHLPAHVHVWSPRAETRYLWPDKWPDVVQTPYPGNTRLSSKDQGRFNGYLEKYGAQIHDKVKKYLPNWSDSSGYCA